MAVRFKPTQPLRDANLESAHLSEAERYWLRMKEAAVYEEPTNITSCAFRPVEPFHLACTSGYKLMIFDSNTCEVVSVYSRFKERVYGAKFRADGGLLGVSDQDGRLSFFDVQQATDKKRPPQLRAPIRRFRAHKGHMVGALDFLAPHGTRAVSAGDDGCAKVFDLASDQSEPLWTCHAHADVVRTVVACKWNEHIVLTGSYDHTIKAWDLRMPGDSSKPAFELAHDHPVEQLLSFSTNAGADLLASAGGPVVKLWDLRAPKFLSKIGHHNKTVTSLCVDAQANCLLSGAIDRRVSVVELDSADVSKHSLVHSFQLESPVLALAMDVGAECMALGMANKLGIWRRTPDERELVEAKRNKAENRRKRFLGIPMQEESDGKRLNDGGGGEPSPKKLLIRERDRGAEEEQHVELALTEQQLDRMSLGKFDKLLRDSCFRELTRSVLASKAAPELVVAIFQQIRIRQQLRQALTDLVTRELRSLLDFIHAHLFNASFFDTLSEVLMKIIEVYAGKPLAGEIKKSIELLTRKINEELKLRGELAKTKGAIKMLLAWNKQQVDESANDEMTRD